ncbi:MAG: cupin [Ponticaulis sp.]|nr:cupin [Ponticaulis sp.]|tara:strand:+ start:10543 stop:10860 length:318 start_codon:yes stop_codon:yes gene_type:complete
MPELIRNLPAFEGENAWDALDVGQVDSATVRVHWTDKPYKWHVNDGAEVFILLSGAVDMKYREDGQEKSVSLKPGDAMTFDMGDEHVAHPTELSRILVIERAGSV